MTAAAAQPLSQSVDARIGAACQAFVAACPFDEYVLANHFATCKTIGRVISRYLPSGGSLLDFGSGLPDKAYVAQALGCRCTVCDDFGDAWYREPGVRDRLLAFIRGLDIECVTPEEAHQSLGSSSFDFVMANAVIEHLHDSPRELVLWWLDLLKAGGYLLVTVPSAVSLRKRLHVMVGRTNMPPYDDVYWAPSPWRGHVREYTHGDLVTLAANTGLEIVELRACTHMIDRVPRGLRSLYAGLTCVLPGIQDSWLLLARKPQDWPPPRALGGSQATSSKTSRVR